MRIIPLIKLYNFRKRRKHIAHHRTPNSIYACILPNVCWKSPERVLLCGILCEWLVTLKQQDIGLECRQHWLIKGGIQYITFREFETWYYSPFLLLSLFSFTFELFHQPIFNILKSIPGVIWNIIFLQNSLPSLMAPFFTFLQLKILASLIPPLS